MAEVDFYDFAPMPCVCLECCAEPAVQRRTFLRAYDSRIEMNQPFDPVGCCDDEMYVYDNTKLWFYDKPPFRSGLCDPPCCCIHSTECGPPVIFVKTDKFLCFDLSECYGKQIMYAPSNYHGCLSGICCGEPCYLEDGHLLIGGVKDPEPFLQALATAVKQHAEANGIPKSQVATFAMVSDNVGDTGGVREIHGAPPKNEEIER